MFNLFGWGQLSKLIRQLDSVDEMERLKSIMAIGKMARDGKDIRQAMESLLDIADSDPCLESRSSALGALSSMIESKYWTTQSPTGVLLILSTCVGCLFNNYSDENIYRRPTPLSKERHEEIRSNEVKSCRTRAGGIFILLGQQSLELKGEVFGMLARSLGNQALDPVERKADVLHEVERIVAWLRKPGDKLAERLMEHVQKQRKALGLK